MVPPDEARAELVATARSGPLRAARIYEITP